MVKPLPKWLMVRYAQLYRTFGQGSFTYTQSQKILKDTKERLSVVLSELRKHGWLTITLDPKDARKRLYSLKDIKEVIAEL